MTDSADARVTELWTAVDRLLANASIAGVLAHELGPLAANRLRRLGEPVPKPLLLEERAASLSMLTATPLLERLRAGCEGKLVLVKGPEVARRYPGNARRFSDLDLLTGHAESVHDELRGAGFVEFEDPEFDLTPEHHHLQPLQWPTIWLKVEVHKYPNWPMATTLPPLREILEASTPSSYGLDELFVPTPAHHALIVAAHAWRHEPLHTLRDLIDVAVLAAEADERDLAHTADAWGIGRVWRTTSRTIDALFYGGARSAPLRSWARHLELVRERSNLEGHLQRLIHAYWGLPPHRASAQAARALRSTLEPAAGETWREKLRRTRQALRNPGAPVTGRDPRLGDPAKRRRETDR
jgi:hypothetical protein